MKRAKEIIIKSRRKLFGQNIGNNLSNLKGNGLDFFELREYVYGDDVRRINWKVSAREQKPYINVFNEERELNIVISFLISGSIYFGSKRQKQDLMAEVLALLSFSAMINYDRVTTIFFDEKINHFFKPTKSQNSIYEKVEYALSLDPIGKRVDFKNLSNFLLNSIKQKSIIFLIGDFYEKVDLTLLSKKHEVYAVIIRDPFEENPKLFGEYDLVDLVSKNHNRLDIDEAILTSYKEELSKEDKNLFEHFRKNRISFSKIYTDEEPFGKLKEMLK